MSSTGRTLTFAAVLVLALAGCAPAASRAVFCELAGSTVTLDLPKEFEETNDCSWTDSDATFTGYALGDNEDIAAQHEQAQEWEGIGGDEDVSELEWEQGVDLFATGKGDVLSFRSAADGDPRRVIVGQSADLQLSFSASADEDDAREQRERFRAIAATVELTP